MGRLHRFPLKLFDELCSYRSLWLPSARNSQRTRSKSEEEANSLWNSVARHSNEVFQADRREHWDAHSDGFRLKEIRRSQEKTKLNGLDLTQGVELSTIPDGTTVLGHAQDEPVLLGSARP
jgi:hypothetical protein